MAVVDSSILLPILTKGYIIPPRPYLRSWSSFDAYLWYIPSHETNIHMGCAMFNEWMNEWMNEHALKYKNQLFSHRRLAKWNIWKVIFTDED